MELKLVLIGVFLADLFAQVLSAATPLFTLPLKFLPDEALLVDVRVNGHGPYVCEFDSGGSDTFELDSEKAKQAGLKATERGASAGVGASVINDERLPGASLVLGSLEIRDHTILMLDTKPDECVFGVGILREFVIQIDYLTQTLRLYDPHDFTPPTGAVKVPITFSAGSPVVDAVITFAENDAVHAELLVDTAVRRFLALSKGFADKHQVLNGKQRVVRPPFGAGGTGGPVELLATRLQSIAIGAARVEDPIALLIRTASGASRREPEGYLGNEFFHRFLLTLDYPHSRLILEPNRHFKDPPAPYDGSGLGIERKRWSPCDYCRCTGERCCPGWRQPWRRTSFFRRKTLGGTHIRVHNGAPLSS
jgi:hypothetical protein